MPYLRPSAFIGGFFSFLGVFVPSWLIPTFHQSIMQHLREEILSIVNHADYKAMKRKLFAKRLGLTGDEAETVR